MFWNNPFYLQKFKQTITWKQQVCLNTSGILIDIIRLYTARKRCRWVKVFKYGPSKICGKIWTVFHIFHLVHSWISWSRCSVRFLGNGLNILRSSRRYLYFALILAKKSSCNVTSFYTYFSYSHDWNIERWTALGELTAAPRPPTVKIATSLQSIVCPY